MQFKREIHALGFRKYTVQFTSGRRVRLHVWNVAPTEETRHNHDWPFVSIPLAGVFRETRWHVQRDAGSTPRRTWSNRQSADCAPLPTGAADSLTPTRTWNRWPLIPYYCPAGAVHTLRPKSGRFHASLVFAGKPRTGVSETWPVEGSGTTFNPDACTCLADSNPDETRHLDTCRSRGLWRGGNPAGEEMA